MGKQKEKEPGELRKSLGPNAKNNFANAIFENIEDLGFGILSKADFETFMYHLLTLNIDENKIQNNYDWMRILKITPSKMRSLQTNQSAKYLNLKMDNKDNWLLLSKSIAKKNIEIEDKNKGTIRFYIDNIHVKRFIEKFVVDCGSSLDYTLNRNQIVLKYDVYQTLMLKLIKEANLNEKSLVSELKNDKNEQLIDKEYTSLKAYFSSFKNAIKDKAIDEIASTTFELVSNGLIKIVKKQLIGN